MATILIAGGTGLIGAHLSTALHKVGHSVRHLSRKVTTNSPYPAFEWNPDSGQLDAQALDDVDVVINLAGAGIADKPWTQGRKEIIISSRVKSTRLLKEAIQQRPVGNRPSLYISSAAIGYYGDRGSEWLDETSKPGTGFLAESCTAWENAIQEIAGLPDCRLVVFRIGLVLTTKGGALPKLLLPVKLGASPLFGGGHQWYSWIHIDDLTGLIQYAIQHHEMKGVFNAVSPNPLTQRDFMVQLSRAAKKPTLRFSLPAFFLRLIMGEMADTILGSSRVSAEKALESGYSFAFTELKSAVTDLLERRI